MDISTAWSQKKLSEVNRYCGCSLIASKPTLLQCLDINVRDTTGMEGQLFGQLHKNGKAASRQEKAGGEVNAVFYEPNYRI